MSRKLVFNPPNDRPNRDAQLADITERVLQASPDYWRAGGFHASIYIDRQSSSSDSMTLMLAAERFYYLEVTISGTTYIPDAQLGRIEIKTPWAGQSPMRIPLDFCVSPEKCAEAVTAFCLRSELEPSINWANDDDVDWEFEPDDAE